MGANLVYRGATQSDVFGISRLQDYLPEARRMENDRIAEFVGRGRCFVAVADDDSVVGALIFDKGEAGVKIVSSVEAPACGEELIMNRLIHMVLAQKVSDAVNHPAHYTSHPSGVEAIDVCEHMTFNVGNAVKYLWRAGLKGDDAEDKRAKHVEDLKRRDGMWIARSNG